MLKHEKTIQSLCSCIDFFILLSLTGCTISRVEGIENITQVQKDVVNGETTLGDALSKLNNPNLEERDNDYKVTRKILVTSTLYNKKSIVVVQYSVGAPFDNFPYLTFKNVVFLLNAHSPDKDRVIDDVKILGSAYLKGSPNLNEYYVMSEEELKTWENVCRYYLETESSSGHFVQFYNLTESSILHEQLELVLGINIDEI